MTLAAPPDIARLRAAMAAAGDDRIRRIELDGTVYWVKHPEKLSLRWRLQKGDPARALERERQAYHALSGRGLPVAECVDEGPDYLVVRDAGSPLSLVFCNPRVAPEEQERALRAGAMALHRLHMAGVAHGRPSLRDMMWDGETIAFIDFERFGATARLRRAKAIDLLLFAFSCYETAGAPSAVIDLALADFRARDRDGVWDDAARMLRRLRWLDPLTARLPKLRGSRDVTAGRLVFRAILDDQAGKDQTSARKF